MKRFINFHLPIALSICLLVTAGFFGWVYRAKAGFSYYSPVTVQAAQVPSTQTDFPMLISYTDNRLKTTGNGGHVQNANGYDVRPYTDSACSSAITYQLEFYSASNGQVVMWAKISSLSNGSVVYLCYGDASLSTDGSSASTWDANYKGVWHFSDGTTLSMADSTGVNNGTGSGSPAAGTGKIDGGVTLSSGNYVDVGNNASLQITGAMTISAWVYPTDLSGYYMGLTKTNGGTAAPYFFFIAPNGAVAWYRGNGTIEVGVISNTGVSTNVWTKLDMTSNGDIYINGVFDKNGSFTSIGDSGTTARIGNRADGFYSPGNMDEVRISNSVRSNDWITTEYNNQNAPATFAVLGTEVPTTTTVPINQVTIKGITPVTIKGLVPVTVKGQ